ncbi:Eco57I restriction-modification methylase domain-containing protein [Propionivibrio sp.]|uniref:Eco57I restriction-modification methylase domain-containing protein n=1 Tax=Propionivibrio sp. TaxID=2212460 RepID=UPI003BF40486
MQEGQLFSSDFLLRGIRETDAWRTMPEAELDAFIAALQTHFAPFSAASTLNESQTENELVEPILDLLGWENAWISQVNLSISGREDVPDFLLFSTAQAKASALDVSDAERARHGIALLEAKRWLRPLDRSEEAGANAATRKRRDFGAPSSQMLRYLSRADVMSDRAVKWGMLTNGAVWRLYWQDARSRAEDFFELDLGALLVVPGMQLGLGAFEAATTLAPRDGLKIFLLFFGRPSFLAQAWDSERRSFHAIALNEARLYQETVSALLGQRVFADVFPALCQVLASGDLQAEKDSRGQYSTAYLDEVREAALILLYRLLFLFYAEDRRLLPVMEPRYAPYSLSALRDEIAHALDSGKVLSIRIANYWNSLDNLFSIIAEGDDSLGMPAYNGGLFERGRSFILARVKVPDAALAPAVDALSRRTDLLKARINYRDLSVTHLGGVYERLLEYKLQQEGEFPQWGPKLFVTKASFARKGSGSYYTHDALVRLVLDESVGLLADERQSEFDQLLKKYRKKAELKPYEWDALDAADPASRFLDLKICDPAMGSGHFLVALVDWLADRTLETAQSAATNVGACGFAAHLEEKGRPWVSPIVSRIAEIRRRIADAAKTHGWSLDLRQLDDRHIIRRMILKRVVFGVDKNPMAVELAKVGLWLHTFTVGAPLSFLDHHLQCGDSLHGEQLASVRSGMAMLGSLFQEGEMSRLQIAAKSLEAVAELTDTSIAEAHESKRLADEATALVAPIHGLLNFWRGLRWRVPGWPQAKLAKLKDEDIKLALSELFSDRYNLTAVIAAGKIGGGISFDSNGKLEEQSAPIAAANRLLAEIATLVRRERFFHWKTAFPTIWPKGAAGEGFDAIIGNPPWDRIKMQEVEWFAERRPEIALQSRAADRKTLIAKEEKRRTPLWHDYLTACAAAESGARAIRESGEFPLLSGGDTNLYSLFVERATSLVAAHGIIGLLTPSGIAADKGASDFFRTLTEADENGAAKLAALFDFENKKVFFPDVDSRFKFCALFFGGDSRLFAQSRCAFYLHDTAELADPARALTLSAKDFRLLNPNTGAAPIFRNQHDADITIRIYRRHPVLVDRSGSVEQRVWPLRYVTMFHMTNDSHLFQKKHGEDTLPLYEGKMVQMYDHRAADVVLNKANLHRAAQQERIPDAIKAQPDRYPFPQYWVAKEEVEKIYAGQWALGFKEITAPTNVRSMIAMLLPQAGFGNKVPLLLPVGLEAPDYARQAALLLANLNSFAFDFVLRQKLQGQTINLFILEQLPVIAPAAFEDEIGDTKIADFIRAEVLALTYTAHDLAPFARDLGYVDENGAVKPPFVWNADDRAHRLARLDALFFYLYGLGRKDAEYILSTFPIVREHDLKTSQRFVTGDRILAYLRRIESGQLVQLIHADLEAS